VTPNQFTHSDSSINGHSQENEAGMNN